MNNKLMNDFKNIWLNKVLKKEDKGLNATGDVAS